MLKNVAYIVLSFSTLFLVGYFAHEKMLAVSEVKIDFALIDVYIFNTFFSLNLCVISLLLSRIPALANQIGLLYLLGSFLKLAAFIFVFKDLILGDVSLPLFASLTLLVPTLTFFALEVYFIVKILRTTYTEQK